MDFKLVVISSLLGLFEKKRYLKKMASKGKGKGKGIAKKFDLEPQKKLIAQYDGALDHNYFIEAHFENKYWKKARILECRLAKGKFFIGGNCFFFFRFF